MTHPYVRHDSFTVCAFAGCIFLKFCMAYTTRFYLRDSSNVTEQKRGRAENRERKRDKQRCNSKEGAGGIGKEGVFIEDVLSI